MNVIILLKIAENDNYKHMIFQSQLSSNVLLNIFSAFVFAVLCQPASCHVACHDGHVLVLLNCKPQLKTLSSVSCIHRIFLILFVCFGHGNRIITKTLWLICRHALKSSKQYSLLPLLISPYEFNGKTLVLKIPLTLFIGHRKNKVGVDAEASSPLPNFQNTRKY